MSDRLIPLIARGAVVRLVWWCRPVRDAVNRWLRPYHGQLSPEEKAAYAERQIDSCFRRAGVNLDHLAGQTVLEIGPGGNFGLAAALLAIGARRVVCVDRDRLCFDADLDDGFYRALNTRLGGRLEGCLEPVGGRWRLPSDRFEYHADVPIERIAFPDHSFDFITSCACLEHVADPAAAIRQMRRLLRPGGRMLHQIDFRDHRDFGRPLEFLRYSDRLWAWLSQGAYTNRWRMSDFRRAFETAGFRLLGVSETGDDVNGEHVRPEYLASIRPHLAERFAALPDEELRSLGGLFLCERSKAGEGDGSRGGSEEAPASFGLDRMARKR